MTVSWGRTETKQKITHTHATMNSEKCHPGDGEGGGVTTREQIGPKGSGEISKEVNYFNGHLKDERKFSRGQVCARLCGCVCLSVRSGVEPRAE